MNHFYDLAELSPDYICELAKLATRLQQYPEPRALEGKVLAMLFMSPSLRTLSSFEAAMVRLGGAAISIAPNMSSHGLETHRAIVMDGRAGEHLRDAVPVIAEYGDAMGLRFFPDRRDLARDLADIDYLEIARLVRKPLINLESATQHPCQALGDWKTLDDLHTPGRRKRLVLAWVYHPRPLPLSGPISTIQMAALRGLDVILLRPDGFALPESAMQRACSFAASTGGSIRETSDMDEALYDADIVYAKEWASPNYYGQPDLEAQLREGLREWRISDAWFKHTSQDCRLLHAMPVRRGVAVDDSVLDGPRSALTLQAGNRMWAQMAIAHELLR